MVTEFDAVPELVPDWNRHLGSRVLDYLWYLVPGTVPGSGIYAWILILVQI